jgi:hypothetical protein
MAEARTNPGAYHQCRMILTPDLRPYPTSVGFTRPGPTAHHFSLDATSDSSSHDADYAGRRKTLAREARNAFIAAD